jgi:itaconyl-CoA hydratase
MSDPVRHGFEGWFEDFRVGDVYRHARGKTVTELDNVLITNLVLNTAEPHFNEHFAQADPMFGQRTVFGGITIAMVVGLAAQDTSQRCLREIGMDKIRLLARVVHGDTLYAYTDVVALEPMPARGGGIVTFRHRGYNQDGAQVFEGERTTLVASRKARP